MGRRLLLPALALAGALAAGAALGKPHHLTLFIQLYDPPSALRSCAVCHARVGSTLNAFGRAVKQAGGVSAGLRAVENEDSDGDGVPNIAEIRAGSFPGNSRSTPQTVPRGLDIVGGEHPLAYLSASGELYLIFRGQERLLSGKRKVGLFAWSPDGWGVAFAAGCELLFARPDGSLAHKAALGQGGEIVRLVWSPLGSRVACVVRRGGKAELWEGLAASGTPRHVADDVLAETVCWSANGEALMFCPVGNARQIMSWPAGAQEPKAAPLRELGHAPAELCPPHAGAGGPAFAYRDEQGRVFVLSEGREKEVLQGQGARALAWAPDGTALAVARGGEVLVVSLPSARAQRVSEAHSGEVLRVLWSPSSGRLAYIVRGENGAELWETALAERRPRCVSRDVLPETVSWRADGQLLAFARKTEANVLLGAPIPEGEPMEVFRFSKTVLRAELAPAL